MAQDTEHVLSQRWMTFWNGHPRASDAYIALTKRYVDNALPYHNLELVARHLAAFDEARFLARDARSVELALWYHRTVCDVTRSDNEAASADFAAQELTKLGLSGYERARIMNLILSIRFGNMPATDDEILMHDILRVPFAGTAEEYERDVRSLRKQHKMIPDVGFSLVRLKVLDMFLRDGIYRSPHFRQRYGARARRNIEMEKTILHARA